MSLLENPSRILSSLNMLLNEDGNYGSIYDLLDGEHKNLKEQEVDRVLPGGVSKGFFTELSTRIVTYVPRLL